jgi:hypothetical protein
MAFIGKLLRGFSYALAVLSLAASVGLMFGDMGLASFTKISASALSAAPLLLVGISFLAAQPVMRPKLADLLKNALLASAFLLWGTIQFMPQTILSRRLGNLVIALYVVDLAWVTLGSVMRRAES